MKTKLLACDIDGTLVHRSQSLNKQDISAIKKFREAGHILSLCTGRTLAWTIPLLEDNSLHVDYLILCNGSQIYSVDKTNHTEVETMKSDWIPNNIGKEILNYFYEKENYTLYWDCGKEKTFEFIDRLICSKTSIIRDRYSEHVDRKYLDTVTSDFVTIGVTPLSANIEDAIILSEEIKKRWGLQVTSCRNQHFVDIGSSNSSKGTGIDFLQRKIGNEIDIYGIGDSFNDIPMFQTVGKSHAFLVKNGEASLSKYADFMVSSVSECIDILLS